MAPRHVAKVDDKGSPWKIPNGVATKISSKIKITEKTIKDLSLIFTEESYIYSFNLLKNPFFILHSSLLLHLVHQVGHFSLRVQIPRYR